MRYLLLLLAAAALLVIVGPGRGPLEFLQWWLFDAQPPSIAVSGSTTPLRGEARFSVSLEPRGRAAVVAASVDGSTLAPGDELVVDTSRLPDGPHRLVVQAQDSSLRRNVTQEAYSFLSDNTPPQLQVQLEPNAPMDGRTLVIRAHFNESASLVGQLGGKPLRFQGKDRDWWAVIGVPPDPAYRELDLNVEAVDLAGNRSVWDQRYPLTRTRFPREVLQVSPDLERVLMPEARAREDARLTPIYASTTDAPRWQGRFMIPVDGPVTTAFGTVRSYNDHLETDYHPGTDFAAPLGARVRAPGDGRVAFSGKAELRGNVLVLDHGYGVFSTYGHLDEILVREGELVHQGDRIALVGSTGLSTGPHLHWEIWVNGANVDPMEWTEREIP